MSNLPRELIMVGMRYQPAYKAGNIKSGDVLVIKREPDNEVNKDAIAVHQTRPNTLLGKDTRVGYIRDADLHLCKNFNFVDHGRYEVTRICPNYLRLQFVSHEQNILVGRGTSVSPPWNMEPPISQYIVNTNNTSGYFIANSVGNKVSLVNPYDEILVKAEQYKEEKLKEKKMINTNSMRDNFFKEVKNVMLDIQSGKLGVKTPDGIITYTDEGVSVNPITDLGFSVPAFAMRVPVEQLTKGDIIISSGDPCFFREASKVGYLTVSTSGVYQETGIVSNMFFGKNTVMAVKNMFGDSGANGMNPLMLMMMMGDDKSGEGFDFKKLMMMQMMMGNQGSSDGMNPMVMAMMMSKM